MSSAVTTSDTRPPVSFLLICDSYPPVMGGSEIEAQRVCSAMIQRGHRALVLCAGGPPMPPVRDWIDPAGVPVRILTRHAKGRWKDAIFACQVARMIWRERHNYEIVYFLMQGLHLAAGLPVARAAGKPIVMKVGGSGVIPLMRKSRAGRVELHWLRKWASRLMVLNQGMMEEAISDGFPSELITWMPNPVDTGKFRPGTPAEIAGLRRRYGIPGMSCGNIRGALVARKRIAVHVAGFCPGGAIYAPSAAYPYSEMARCGSRSRRWLANWVWPPIKSVSQDAWMLQRSLIGFVRAMFLCLYRRAKDFRVHWSRQCHPVFRPWSAISLRTCNSSTQGSTVSPYRSAMNRRRRKPFARRLRTVLCGSGWAKLHANG